MFDKLKRRAEGIVKKHFKKPQEPTTESDPILSPPSPPSMGYPQKHGITPFLFPATESSVLPDPSLFFSPKLRSRPLPTHSFFQNFTLRNGDQPEYIHPYLVKPSPSSLSISYPSLMDNPVFARQAFTPDITISGLNQTDPYMVRRHVVSSYSDLSVTLDFPSANLQFFLVRGSPFLTCNVLEDTSVSISTIHAILSVSSNGSNTKHTIRLNNYQTWLVYTSSPVNLCHDYSSITCRGFTGVLRIAVLPETGAACESILDQFSSCYPVSGEAHFTKPYCMEYQWKKKGWGELLMLAHPLHLNLLSGDDCKVIVLKGFKYRSIDGDLFGVVGDSWVLKPDPVPVTWHSSKGVKEESFEDIVSALTNDVDALDASAITTTSSYFYGKLIARAARLALIAEEVSCYEVIPAIKDYLKSTIEPWLDGTFEGNGFLYDRRWGGITTQQGSQDAGADFGFGVYNDHHYHLGYFLYAIAVLAKIDPAWGRKYKPQAYSLMADFMNLGRRSNSHFPRLRCFDLFKLHSWAGGLREFADGRNQESTSEAVNAYYSAALMGLAYGDMQLANTGSMLAAMEIHSAQTWWHVKADSTLYPEDFTLENRILGIVWANKRDSGLWFAPQDWRECRLGIQVLPILPITEALFSDTEFVRQLVEWVAPALEREEVTEGWKGFVHALEGMYDKETALENITGLSEFDDGNSLTNLLWWIHSRGDEEEDEEEEEEVRVGRRRAEKHCWFGYYCH